MAATLSLSTTMDPPRQFFDNLPIEVRQRIATFLDYDSDLCSFRLVCHSTHDAVDADKCSFWRRRFLAFFDRPAEEWKGPQGNVKFKKEYQLRRRMLKRGAHFTNGASMQEQKCLEVLRDLMVDACGDKNSDDEAYESANLAHLQTFILSNHGLFEIFNRQRSGYSRATSKRSSTATSSTPSLLMHTVQVMCAPTLLSFEPILETFGFPASQAVVYSTAAQHPIFHGCHGLDVNMAYVLHNINFWKYHMLREAEGTLYYAFSELEQEERPRWWDSELQQGVGKLGKYWKGSYAYVQREEIDELRSGQADEEQIQDIFAGEDEACKFQDMRLEITEDAVWPPIFEEVLRSCSLPVSRAKTRAQKRSGSPEAIADCKPQSFHFQGEGQDVAEEFFASGWLNPLPAQEKIPGWQRMTMMKYFENDDGSIDTAGLWAYEGVVLPGGQIIVGRWWSPMDGGVEDAYSGPFILWCVDGPKYADAEVVEK